jgi:predicted MFS family arabinose efflux permease
MAVSPSATVRTAESASWLPLIAVCLAQMTAIVNPAVTSTAVGALVADLQTAATTVQTALVLYALFSAALMLVGSRLGGYIGMLGAAAGIGGSIGLLGGGALVGTLGWRAPYLVIVVISLITLGVSLMIRPSPKASAPPAVDVVGALLSIFSLLSLVSGLGLLGTWGLLLATPAAPFSFYGVSPAGILLLLGLLLIQSFFAWQRRRVARSEAPLISPLVTDSQRERSTLLLMIIGGFGAAGISFLIPLYVQMVLGYSAFATALILLPLAVGTFAGALLAAPLRGHRPPRLVVNLAMLLKLFALLQIAITLSNSWSSVVLALALALLGLSNGVISATLSTVIVSASAPELGADVGALR